MVADRASRLKVWRPLLSAWLGDRLDIHVPAFLVSLTVHGLILGCLALTVGYSVQREIQREFKNAVVDNSLPASDSTFQDLDQSNNPPPVEARLDRSRRRSRPRSPLRQVSPSPTDLRIRAMVHYPRSAASTFGG